MAGHSVPWGWRESVPPPAGAVWTSDESDYLPNGSELSRHLAATFSCPPAEIADLLRVSEYVALTSGSGALYRELHDLFNRDYPPTASYSVTLCGVGLTM